MFCRHIILLIVRFISMRLLCTRFLLLNFRRILWHLKLSDRYSARIVEVNPVFSIVEKNGMSEEITALYEELRGLGCVLQFVRSGRVAITTSCFERVNEYLTQREEKYRQQKTE